MPTTLYTREQRRLVELLRAIRAEAGLTQEQVARRLRRPQSFVSKYEAGQRRLDLIELRAVARALGSDLITVVKRFDQG